MIREHRNLAGLIFAGAAGLTPLAASAADLYRNPPPASTYVPPAAYVDTYSWAGFYAGINGGYGWTGDNGSIGYGGGIFDGDSSGRAQPQGGFGGGQIGYNFQSGSIVYGVETDFQGSGISDRVTGTTALGNGFTSRESIDWFGTVRARLGYSFGRVLVYGTGGFAYGNVRERALLADTGGDSASLGANGTQTGWVAGGGIEYKVTPNWSVKGEYQHIDLGTEKLYGFDSGGSAVTTNSLETSFDTVRLGLNYRFGGGAEPLK
jgi:outer membrane immunogenic protein